MTYINSNMAWAAHKMYFLTAQELTVNHVKLDITIKLSCEVNKLMKLIYQYRCSLRPSNSK